MTAMTSEALELLTHLHAGGSWGYWWTLPGKASSWWPVGSPAPVPPGQVNVYFGVHPAGQVPERYDAGRQAPPEKCRSTIADITAISCLFAEFDAKDFGDKARALAHIEGLELLPSVIVDSGGGYHGYWLLSKPFIFEDQADRERARLAQAAWVAHVGGDKGAKDLARVLRLPGTLNRKYDPPAPVGTIRADYALRYALQDLEAAARPAAGTDAQAIRTPQRAQTAGNGRQAPSGDTGGFWLDRALGQARPGNRNATGFWLAAQLRDAGLAQHDAEAIMADYAQRVPADTKDPYTLGDALGSLHQAYKAEKRDPAQSAAGRLKWGGRRGDRATMRRGNVKYTVTAEGNTLAVRASAGQGRDHVDVTLDRENPDFDGAAGAIANGLAMATEEARQDLAAIPGEMAAHPQPAEVPPPAGAETLAHFAPWVNAQLGERSGRATKATVGDAIRAWLLARGRLVCDLATDRPYMLADDARALPLDDQGLALLATLAAAGMNPTEPAFQWLLSDLQIAAYRDGRKIRLARWAMAEGSTLYLSCGPLGYVVASPDAPLELRANGAEGIVFAADASLPAWRHDAQPISPLELHAFQPAMITPPETPEYTPEVQRRLLAAWLCALVAGLRPLPILAALGDKGGGKSTLGRAIMRLALGPDADLSPLSADEKDFWTVATGRPVMGLDNVDATPALWLPDALAVAATGGRRQVRELYTTRTVADYAISAAVVVTSRTATFARPDVAERILPILTGELDDAGRCADSALTHDVAVFRDGALVYLAQTAANVLSWRAQAPRGLPARFLDFAEIVWSWHKATGQETAAVPTLQAWRAAQALAIGDADPLLAAILECGEKVPEPDRTKVSPSALIKALGQAGAELPYMGGGKEILRKLREFTASLRLASWVVSVDPGEHTTVTLRHVR
jgi:RepB DNA-primase from phage plasmid